jgi:hypothetical protein
MICIFNNFHLLKRTSFLSFILINFFVDNKLWAEEVPKILNNLSVGLLTLRFS